MLYNIVDMGKKYYTAVMLRQEDYERLRGLADASGESLTETMGKAIRSLERYGVAELQVESEKGEKEGKDVQVR